MSSLARELKKEFPAVDIESVQLAKDNRVSVVGPDAASLEHSQVTARAQELWDARGRSLTHVVM